MKTVTSDYDCSDVMRGFPPPREQRVTLENWRTVPFSHWAFRNIRQLLPTAQVSRAVSAGDELAARPTELGRISFEGVDGQETCLDNFLQDSHTNGFAVLHDNALVFEHYAHGLVPDSAHILFSITKSVTATLIGILTERGVLDPDALVCEYLPEVAASAYADARVRHLLDMTVGIQFNEDYENETGDFARYRLATGWLPSLDPATVDNLRDFLVTLQKDGEHGEEFHYVSPNSDLLGWLIERVTGVAYAEVLSRELWQPMGAGHDAYINVDRVCAPRSAGGLCMTLRDLVRFGRLHLPVGSGTNTTLVPQQWLQGMRGNSDPVAWDHGNTWDRKSFADFMPGWRYRDAWYVSSNGAYGGLGVFGQYLHVDPKTGIVIAKFSAQPRALDNGFNSATYRAFTAIEEFFSH